MLLNKFKISAKNILYYENIYEPTYKIHPHLAL